MAANPLAGLTVVSFEARRADELATLLTRQGATVVRAPALREAPLPASPEALALARGLEEGAVDAVVLLTGVGTRALAYVLASPCPRFRELLAGTRLVARGPKPLAALRELGVPGAHPVPDPFTWRQVLTVVDGLALRAGGVVAVQEYGVPVPSLTRGLAERGFRVLRVPVYRWELPEDTGPLRDAAATIARGAADVAVFTNSAQVEHLFRVAPDAARVRTALARAVVASVGPVTSEALEAHGVPADLEASPPKMGPLVALIADRAQTVLAGKRAAG
jgi:uroporphyrinogen-III synthase